jgi:hypothetical protein
MNYVVDSSGSVGWQEPFQLIYPIAPPLRASHFARHNISRSHGVIIGFSYPA